MQNQTAVTEFILLGFTETRWLQILLFLALLFTYLLTMTGNIVIITITLVDRRLHTPMYFFLRNFSVLEIGFTSVVIPKMLSNLLSVRKTISVVACFIQLFFYFFLGVTEFFLLATMSFDRYVAICNPLRYPVIMNSRLCIQLVMICWLGSLPSVLITAIIISQLPFCGSNVIDHFFCDNLPLLKLACADTRLIELINFILAVIILLGTLVITAVSYIHIISTILRLPSAKERQRAFSTCSSHIIVVTMFYGSCIFMYVRPTRARGLDLNKGVAILNTVVTPLLNPFIYSLRNKQVQEVLRDLSARFFNKRRC
ncbi:olfactory receptor 6E1-like [Alligator mississippiensis]|uniref:olfactory receptor 6E1-like n=1 Tax=Alligator mississippiensis TaxID=8496 RepID=UPI0028775416|nr:olfactory receptor 6E1-like [Alligator mississippiensis]